MASNLGRANGEGANGECANGEVLLYAAFMDLKKAYDRVNRDALWSVLKIYGVGGQL